jgi:hypothetical protein
VRGAEASARLAPAQASTVRSRLPCQDDRHRLGMYRADFDICVGGQKPKQLMLALHRVRLGAALAVPGRPDAGEHSQRPVLTEREPCRRLSRLGIAYSQNDVNGTPQRFSGFSQARQCGLLTLRMLVIGAPPKAGGPGMPHRAIASSRTPSGALLAIGARESGKTPGIGGRFSVRSRIARTRAMIAACPLVRE